MYAVKKHTLVTVAIVGSVIGVACGDAAANRSGGESGGDNVVLTVAHGSDGVPPAQLVTYGEHVSELTDGSVTFEFTSRNHDDPDGDRKTVDDVRAGTVDMAAMRLRPFDTFGVGGIQPLMAPLLIDSYELQQAVIESDIPDRVLGSFDSLGVTGAAVLPGPLARMVGRTHPILTVEDFAGQAIAATPSDVVAETFTTLGATPKPWVGGMPLADFDAIVMQFGAIWGRHYELEADAVTSNLVMWPGTSVVVVNPDVFESLSDDQQAALRTAAVDALPSMIDETIADEDAARESLCDAGLTFTLTSDEQLAGIREALQPVYDVIAGRGDNAAVLAQIEMLKEDLAVPPDGPTCETAAPPTDAGSFPEGT